jgi:hypothetical protein
MVTSYPHDFGVTALSFGYHSTDNVCVFRHDNNDCTFDFWAVHLLLCLRISTQISQSMRPEPKDQDTDIAVLWFRYSSVHGPAFPSCTTISKARERKEMNADMQKHASKEGGMHLYAEKRWRLRE